MEWLFTEIVEEAIPTCTVCRRRLDGPDYDHDMFYIPDPDETTYDQWNQIFEIWGSDFIVFCVCEDCVAGHCGAVSHLTPDGWLAKHWEAHLNRQKAAE